MITLTNPPTVSDQILIASVLADLGETADDVAQKLFSEGVSGVVASSALCPVSNYLSSRLATMLADEDAVVLTEGECVHVLTSSEARISQPLPRPVREFVERFDFGGYRELDVDAVFRTVEYFFDDELIDSWTV